MGQNNTLGKLFPKKKKKAERAKNIDGKNNWMESITVCILIN